MSSPASVQVNVRHLADLFEKTELPIAVDTYQRGFVWDDEKVMQLVSDLVEYENAPSPKPDYYMGTILLHRDAAQQRLFVIDGQQRLTALCLLYRQLFEKLPASCAMTYSPASARRIRAAALSYGRAVELPTPEVFRKIAFTVICVDRVDLAFTFFDTQNNRGVPLHATDLLKAYHLRAVDAETTKAKEGLQELCARRWENIQKGTAVMSHDEEFARTLFSLFLWRARCWSGSEVTIGSHDKLLDEFERNTWRSEEGGHGTIPLYRSRHNRLGTHLAVDTNGYGEIHTNRIALSPKSEELPMAIRQPINKGVGFFLYADKYSALLRWLVNAPTESVQVTQFREIYSTLLKGNSVYLREIFLLASLMYVDQYGDEHLWEFALRLEHALGAIRLKKDQVRVQTAQNFFRKSARNLLDVIATSYRPEEVIRHLAVYHHGRETYTHPDIGQIAVGKGVQDVYKKAVLKYFGMPDTASLHAKEAWISNKLKGSNT